MNELETRQLRYFVAVAEEEHFGRAAERLGMAQPPLSRAIGALERQLGVQLFVRTTRRVALTRAGRVLLDHARVALEAVALAESRARHAGAGEPTLRLALKADQDAGLLPGILAAYKDTPVELLLGAYGEQATALRDGRADVALIVDTVDDSRLDSEVLVTGPRVVALAASDPLASRPSLRLPDLTGRSLPHGQPAEHGYPAPSVPRNLLDHSQIFNLIEVGGAVWFLPVWVAERFPRPGIVYRPIAGLAPATLSIAWPERSRSTAVASFVRTAQRVARTAPEARISAGTGARGLPPAGGR
ncbi:putative LysR family transcriptional regulator [Actinacidiphila reveromycinica]|uniref:Putative LysR family transcriptional regulator n=1 Tax=Actinacidiphila reveromycinica TaxID=659352 RepID=A0A7U3VMZ1_9ACTN|nr:LysR family transcriptional regulator [Streptomyces sp. SN-593]BBA97130.1 putative LysR family transcriptional regulator [Streptomyces sp. SN-593]